MQLKWEFDAVLSNIDPVSDLVEEQLELLGCSMKTQLQIRVVIDELFSNICNYAYPDGKGTITVAFDSDENHIYLTFIDQGIAFDPFSHQAEALTELPGDDREGGLGILLSRKLTDAMEYRFENDHNILLVIKRIHP